MPHPNSSMRRLLVIFLLGTNHRHYHQYTDNGSLHHVLSPFYYKTGTMGWIGSTSYVLPIQLSYRTLNRVIRVGRKNVVTFILKEYLLFSFLTASLSSSDWTNSFWLFMYLVINFCRTRTLVWGDYLSYFFLEQIIGIIISTQTTDTYTR